MTTAALGAEIGISIDCHTIAGHSDGPTVVILGGVHGDELEGIMAASILRHELHDLASGTVHVIPRANPDACAAVRRESATDGKNLARSFPGDPSGTTTDRIAATLTALIADADLLIDLHSGGFTSAMPLFAGFIDGVDGSSISERMANAFGAPLLWRHDGINPGRSLSAAAEHGVPAIYVEAGFGGGGLSKPQVDRYVAGVQRVLATLGMLNDAPPATEATVEIGTGSGNTDESFEAAASGWCLRAVEPGDVVDAGDLLAEIRDRDGEVVDTIIAPTPGRVMLIRVVARVEAGDGIAMLAPIADDGAPR